MVTGSLCLAFAVNSDDFNLCSSWFAVMHVTLGKFAGHAIMWYVLALYILHLQLP